MSAKPKSEQAPPAPITAAQSIVLCYYSTTAPATNTLNRSATARVVGQAGAAKKVARVYNTILNARGTAIGRGLSVLQRTGVNLRRLGLPCPMGGIYLRVRDIPAAQNIFDDGQAELDVVREDILRSYPDLIAPLKADLGAFANEVNIPTASDVARRFSMHMTVVNRPAPVANNVLVGLTSEVANRVRAESQQQIDEMLRASHAGPVEDLREVLVEFIDRMRNAERLHLSQFGKLRDEARRVRDLNVMGLPEVDEVIDLAVSASLAPAAELTKDERHAIAKKAERAVDKANDTLAALGL